MPQTLAVDRIEGEWAVCEAEGRVMHTLPLAELPEGVREGDCLRLLAGRYHVDAEETRRRRAHNRDLLRRLLRQEEGEEN